MHNYTLDEIEQHLPIFGPFIRLLVSFLKRCHCKCQFNIISLWQEFIHLSIVVVFVLEIEKICL